MLTAQKSLSLSKVNSHITAIIAHWMLLDENEMKPLHYGQQGIGSCQINNENKNAPKISSITFEMSLFISDETWGNFRLSKAFRKRKTTKVSTYFGGAKVAELNRLLLSPTTLHVVFRFCRLLPLLEVTFPRGLSWKNKAYVISVYDL